MTARLLCVGDLNADITVAAPSGIADGSDTAGTVAMSGGGSAANVAAWAAECGSPSRFVGVVGADALGDFLADELAGHGVDVRAIRRDDAPSRAIAAIVGSDGNRSMVSSLDPATVLAPSDVAPTWFDDIGWLHLTGYTYLQPTARGAFTRLVEIAAEAGIPWSIDPSSAAMLNDTEQPSDVLAAFSGAAVMFPSHDEAAWMTGVAEPTAAGERLLDIADTVVVTCGDRGAVVARRDRATLHVDAVPADLVNTLGCGDAFAGGFLAGRLAGVDDADCAAQAVRVAARVASIATSR
ncbi:carbohydrate kinase family protein [Ilumatobacter nonamiensis]|uniref:carbohydrate kinase family protein n=1 Tax=Ilumatobacter nonamiensis TaxID=467093 RepID=UPI0003485396|nr:PfkB family carbohydrate kinase [Ilumatobacter nonamiensis]